jgi:hypothetical protein
MATTTATLSLRSSDLIPSQVLSLTSSKRLNKAGSANDGVDQMDMGRVEIVADTSFDLLDATALGLGKSNYVYLTNKSTSDVNFVTVITKTATIGRLYAGDFMWMPWSAHEANADIEVTSTGGTATLEYAVFHEGKTLTASGDGE